MVKVRQPKNRHSSSGVAFAVPSKYVMTPRRTCIRHPLSISFLAEGSTIISLDNVIELLIAQGLNNLTFNFFCGF